MSAGTQLATVDKGGFLALSDEAGQVAEIVEANLDGQQITERDLTRLTVPSGGGTAWEREGLTGKEHVSEIVGILVFKKRTRGYWPLPVGEGDDNPVCRSDDAITGFGRPWATASDPDPDGEPERRSCAECPLSEFGSGKNGGQACQEKAHWFMLDANGYLPIVMSLPAMSLAPAKGYMLKLAQAGLMFNQVVTKLTLEKVGSGGNAYSRVIPQMVGLLDPDEAAQAKAYADRLAPVLSTVTMTERQAEPTAEPTANGNGNGGKGGKQTAAAADDKGDGGDSE